MNILTYSYDENEFSVLYNGLRPMRVVRPADLEDEAAQERFDAMLALVEAEEFDKLLSILRPVGESGLNFTVESGRVLLDGKWRVNNELSNSLVSLMSQDTLGTASKGQQNLLNRQKALLNRLVKSSFKSVLDNLWGWVEVSGAMVDNQGLIRGAYVVLREDGKVGEHEASLGSTLEVPSNMAEDYPIAVRSYEDASRSVGQGDKLVGVTVDPVDVVKVGSTLLVCKVKLDDNETVTASDD